jgi:hypothetical protein
VVTDPPPATSMRVTDPPPRLGTCSTLSATGGTYSRRALVSCVSPPLLLLLPPEASDAASSAKVCCAAAALVSQLRL